VRSVAARLDRDGVQRVDQLLTDRPMSEELHGRVLRAAAGLDEEDQLAADGRAQNAADPAAWVEAALRLSERYLAAGRLDRAGRVLQNVRDEIAVGMLAEEQRHRLALARLRVLLGQGQPITAGEHTREALEADPAPPVEALAECWLDAVRKAKEDERTAAARELARRMRDLFEGLGAAQPALSSETLRQLEPTDNAP
jgi:tetratricopeptide (TPR) repeat protein